MKAIYLPLNIKHASLLVAASLRLHGGLDVNQAHQPPAPNDWLPRSRPLDAKSAGRSLVLKALLFFVLLRQVIAQALQIVSLGMVDMHDI